LEIVRGGFYFHLSVKRLSLGAPEQEKPFSIAVSAKSGIENAAAAKFSVTIFNAVSLSNATSVRSRCLSR
jgi:hypothetical protein